MKHSYHIGLDVHAKSTSIAYAGCDGSLEYYGSCASSNLSVERTLRKLAARLGTEFQSLKVCYEAGPTGFVLARRLMQLGLEVTVVAPSLSRARAAGICSLWELIPSDAQPEGLLADEPERTGAIRAEQPLAGGTRGSRHESYLDRALLRAASPSLIGTALYGAVRRVVWDRGANHSPGPD